MWTLYACVDITLNVYLTKHEGFSYHSVYKFNYLALTKTQAILRPLFTECIVLISFLSMGKIKSNRAKSRTFFRK